MSLEKLLCLTKVGMEAMLDTAGQCGGAMQQEEIHPFPAWLALVLGSALFLSGAVIPHEANTLPAKAAVLHSLSGAQRSRLIL